jgi:putative membrane protein
MTSRWTRRDLILASVVLCAGAMVLAQQPGSTPMPSTQGTPGQMGPPSQTMPGAPGAATDNAGQSYGDQAFLRKTMEDNMAQEQMGQLAAQKSPSDDVKQFGQKMAEIHEQLTNQLMPVAKKLGVDEPKQPSKRDRQQIEKMQGLSGPDFDSAFIRAMLKDQQDDLKVFKTEADGAQDPTVQQAAKMDEPVLNQHLQILEKIAQAHNVSEESSK